MNVRCLEQIQKGAVTFRTGEEYTASTINENWYVVDSIGFETDDFHLHFEIVEEGLTEEEASECMGDDAHQLKSIRWPEAEIPIVPGLWGDEEKKTQLGEAEKMTIWDRVVDYVFA
jgi:hypothetical protein